jgi:pimeloyl-ACP methyl ester carboxylesterase
MRVLLRFAVRAPVLAVLAMLLAAGAARAGFYDATPKEVAGPPGSLIRYEVMDPSPAGGIAFRILYRSIGLHGEPIAVSGVVVRPPGSPPPGGRPVVAWAHPTTGIARHCAPSLFGSGWTEIPGLQLMLSRGYVVVATDYPGLGTATRHPYIVGTSEARAVLDSVRAADALREAGAGRRFIVWGHSQGGHAALFTGEMAGRYAPELRLMGIAAAAPATDLAQLFEADLSTVAGKILTAMALTSWSEVYETPSSSLILAKYAPAVRKISAFCIESALGDLAEMEAQKPLGQKFLAGDPAAIKPWADFIRENSPGRERAGAPVLIAQGTADTVVDPPVTEAYVAALCKRGTRVVFLRYPKTGHAATARRSANQTVAWMAGRFAAAPVTTPCGQ